jgi:quercetin dioxygenase-like cupin family protein
MHVRNKLWLSALSLILFVSSSVRGQEMGKSAGQNVAEMKFVELPGLPTCVTGSVQNGDPTKSSSIILGKMPTGCAIPWHWHTPGEHLMMISGVARVEMKDGKPLTLKAGGFAMMPSHHVHQFHCEQDCLVYIYSDKAFDIHYVNGKGTEISPADALKPFKETPATGK